MKTILIILMLFCISATSAIAQYNRNQQIVAAEYFINTDPGEGNGTTITGIYNLWEVIINVSGLDVPVGSRLYVRFKSSNNTWSAPRCIVPKEYFTNSGASLVYGEYFINTDPGRGNGTPVTIEPDKTINLYNMPLKRGDKVYFRVKDSFNRWSPARAATFRFKDITKADYYIKRVGGRVEPTVSMLMSAVNESSSVFIAYKDSVPARTNDTVYVRFQTSDHFRSKWYSAVETYPINVKEVVAGNLPTQYALSQNYPNPFNPSTTIKYALPQASQVNLSVFNTLGQRVALLVDGKQEAGYHEMNLDASGFTSGVYFYRLSVSPSATRDLVPTSRDGQAGDPSSSSGQRFTETKKLILLK
ncbi:MAG: T9SS type A sorting domain-containing protein [Bacteroidota bacterium]|nr:T9SS type A sorting domain-containing protein [Bacteroidota bacterium]